ncbi:MULTISPECIES: hypothetical protein [unclassified Streptomyces]|uniref:hypothetical protein n=1 Tax=unclassified Streptomyces TaxID=2593676 RepID=UPI00073C5CC6|nr:MULTISPECIES: hypothetical protein [unclassified Streptomyces]ODA74049.1 hypothetical protein APS67_001595 [Streptomyces sp. AVP053U2]
MRAVAARFTAVGAEPAPVAATCYLYPAFEPLREHLAVTHGVHDGDALAGLLSERYGVGVLPASAFGESGRPLRIRAATSHFYGDTDERRTAALEAADPLTLPWIREAVDRVGEILADLTGADVPTTLAPHS